MINRDFVKAELYNRTSEEGVLKPVEALYKVKYIDVALYTLTGSKTQYNSVNASKSTHFGLVKDNSINNEMLIKYNSESFNIDFMIPGRLTQVYLTLVKENG